MSLTEVLPGWQGANERTETGASDRTSLTYVVVAKSTRRPQAPPSQGPWPGRASAHGPRTLASCACTSRRAAVTLRRTRGDWPSQAKPGHANSTAQHQAATPRSNLRIHEPHHTRHEELDWLGSPNRPVPAPSFLPTFTQRN